MTRTITTILLFIATLPSGFALSQEFCGPTRYVSPPEVGATHFGFAVATNGRQWFIGDSQASTLCTGSPFACSTGAVHVYEMLDGELVHVQTIVPHDAQLADMFGTTMKVDGDRLVVGALNTTWPGRAGRPGAVFIYEFDGEEWVETSRIEPPAEVTAEFGTMLALEGDFLAVRRGSRPKVYVYRKSQVLWSLIQSIESPNGLPRDAEFGSPGVLDSHWLFVGAHRDASVIANGGSAYVFRRDEGGEISFRQKLIPPDPLTTRLFGAALAKDGETLAIGAPHAEREFEFQGAVLIYERVGDQWVYQQEITHSRPREGALFGVHVELRGNLLLVSTGREPSPKVSSGLVYAFRKGADGLWHETDILVPNPPFFSDLYGISLATDGRFVLVGAQDDRHASASMLFGAAYLFDMSCRQVCQPDLDHDGVLTIFDYLTFQTAFGTGDPLADFDGDSELTLFDFLAFQTAFGQGCP